MNRARAEAGKNTNTVTVRVLLIQQACRAVILHPQMMIMLVAGAWLPRLVLLIMPVSWGSR